LISKQTEKLVDRKDFYRKFLSIAFELRIGYATLCVFAFNVIIDDNYIRKILAKALVLSVAILDNRGAKRKQNRFNTIYNMVAIWPFLKHFARIK